LDSRIRHIFAVLAGVICFVIYLLTLHPSITFIDSGELAAVSYIFGVPHPTGYPLFLIIGYIVSHLPFGGSVIYRLNLVSAIESAAAVTVTFYSVVLVAKAAFIYFERPGNKQKTENTDKDKSKKKPKNFTKETIPGKQLAAGLQNPVSAEILIYLVSFFTAITTGFGKTLWFNATQVEVYALHSLFISILLYFCLKILLNRQAQNKSDWLYLFLFFGLSAANHSTTIYFIPGIIYLWYIQFRTNRAFARFILPYILLVVPGLLLYLVLMVSASAKPYLNWSDPASIGNLINHIRGSDFSQLMFSSNSRFSENFFGFFKTILSELTIISLVLSVIGIFIYWKSFRNFVIFSTICIITSLLYSFNYNSIEISSFYLLVYYLLGMMVSGALIFIAAAGKKLTTENLGSIRIKLVAAGLITVISAAAFTYKDNDNSRNLANAEYTQNTLNAMEQNSILLCYDWSYQYSGSFYYQLVDHVRQDVKVLNVKFLSVPWYLFSVQKYYPDIYEGIKSQADEYLAVYEQDEKVKSPRLAALVKAFIESARKKYPLFITIDLVLSKEMSPILNTYKLDPAGLVYKVDDKNSAYDPSAGILSLAMKFDRFEPTGNYKKNLAKYIPGLYYETAYYHYINKNFELSLKFLEKSLEFDPAFRDALSLRTQIQSKRIN
jgi:hypothetical protein